MTYRTDEPTTETSRGGANWPVRLALADLGLVALLALTVGLLLPDLPTLSILWAAFLAVQIVVFGGLLLAGLAEAVRHLVAGDRPDEPTPASDF